ncbi:MAG: hypothetical protein AB4372_32980 [Xenococcus sp. (in: cyanobacteria)]
MSTIDKMTVNEQLFTELTPEEGAVVEGGATFTLHSVYAAKADKQDDLYLKFNGEKVFGVTDMDNYDYKLAGKSKTFHGWGRLNFYDDDFWSGDDYLGGKWIYESPAYWHRAQATGKGYDYTAYYSVS